MSRNEGEEEEELFVWRVFFCEKAYLLSRVTVVREGMICDEMRWDDLCCDNMLCDVIVCV